MTNAEAVKKLDKVFSEYIRRRKADYNGNAICVTCGKTDHWKQMQAGHYFSRAKRATRWDTRNVHVQCYRCNVLLKGNYTAYARYMYRLYGEAVMDELTEKSERSTHFKTYELEDTITEVKQRLALLTN